MRHALLFVFSILAMGHQLWTVACAAEQSHAHEVELRAALARDVIDPHEVLQALLGESGRFHSGDHEPDGFSVEILGFDDNGDEVRLIGDYSDTGFRSLEFQGTSRISFRHNRDALHFRSKLWTVSEMGDVNISWEAMLGKPGETPGIDVSISGMIGPKPEWASVEYQPGISELRASDSANRSLIVRLRSPNDAARFGSSISHASWWKDGACQRELRRPVRGVSPQRLPRLQLPEFQQFYDQVTLNPKAAVRLQSWFKNSGIPDAKGLTGKMATPELLLAVGSLGKPASLPFQEWAAEQAGLQERAAELLREKSIYNAVRESAESALFRETRGFVDIANMMRLTQDTKSFQHPLTDDGVIRNWIFETNTSLIVLHPFYRNFVETFIQREDLALSLKVRCAYALSRLGRPATLTIPRFDVDGQNTIHASLSVGWELPGHEQDLAACREIVRQSPENTLFGIARQCLLLSNQYDQISQVDPDRWWVRDRMVSYSDLSKVIDQDQALSESSKAELNQKLENDERWSAIWEMSRFPTSRKLLRSRLDSTDPLQIRRLALTALRLRARASLDQQRFDFMPRAECEEILAIPDLEVGGRDSEAGPARPFPTEP